MQSFGYVRTIDEKSRQVTVLVSTGKKARDGMIISPDGWVLEHYHVNPVVLWAHDASSLPIAKAIRTDRTPDGLVQVHEFATSPRADEIFQMIVGGFINATSVRWLPIDARFEFVDGEDVLVFIRQELLETSWLPVPSDPYCVAMRADGAAVDVDELAQRLGIAPRARARARVSTPITKTFSLATPAPRHDADAEDVASLLARLDALDDDDARTLYDALTERLAEPASEPGEGQPLIVTPPETEAAPPDVNAETRAVLTALAPQFARMEVLLAPPDLTQAIVATLAAATGRTEEDLRARLAVTI